VGEAISRILRTAVVDTQLKQGLFGISVKLMPPNVTLPDRPTIKEIEQTPTVPKPVIEEIVSVEPAAEIPEVAEIADTKKA